MLFKDVLAFFVKRAKESGKYQTQEDYADGCKLPRAVINQLLRGKPASVRYIDQVLSAEGLELHRCIDIPEMSLQRESILVLAETILKRRDKWAERLEDAIKDVQRHIEEQSVRASPTRKQRGV